MVLTCCGLVVVHHLPTDDTSGVGDRIITQQFKQKNTLQQFDLVVKQEDSLFSQDLGASALEENSSSTVLYTVRRGYYTIC
jgi:hypothetical protein